MAEKFLILPNADTDVNGLPTTLANATIAATTSVTGLTNGTAYRALVLQNPSDAFTPNVSAYTDDFNRANELLEANAKWSKLITTDQQANIVSNQLVISTATTAASNAYYEYLETLTNDQYAELEYLSDTVSTTNTGVFSMLVRAFHDGSGLDGYLCQGRKNNNAYAIRIFRLDNGAATLLGSEYSWTPSANDVVRLEASGTSIQAKLNGSVVVGPVTDATYSGGFAGIGTYAQVSGQTMTVDNFECGNL